MNVLVKVCAELLEQSYRKFEYRANGASVLITGHV